MLLQKKGQCCNHLLHLYVFVVKCPKLHLGSKPIKCQQDNPIFSVPEIFMERGRLSFPFERSIHINICPHTKLPLWSHLALSPPDPIIFAATVVGNSEGVDSSGRLPHFRTIWERLNIWILTDILTSQNKINANI